MPKGRPKGSKNKPKEVTPEPDTKKRGRPSGSKYAKGGRGVSCTILCTASTNYHTRAQ